MVAHGCGRSVAAYVEVIRNTPLIVQLFIVFFGLPSAGIRLDAMTAAIIALAINLGAYSTEIIRAGLEAVPKGTDRSGSLTGVVRHARSVMWYWCRRSRLCTRRSRANLF